MQSLAVRNFGTVVGFEDNLSRAISNTNCRSLRSSKIFATKKLSSNWIWKSRSFSVSRICYASSDPFETQLDNRGESVPEDEGIEEKIISGAGKLGALLFFVTLASAMYVDSAKAIPAVATEEQQAKSAEKKKSLSQTKGKKAKKSPRLMTFEERQQWVKELPIVEEKIPYTDLLQLKKEDNLKAIVKHPRSALMRRPELCLVVRSDDTVFRTVLPLGQRDENFWAAWKAEDFDSLVINAFTPSFQLPSPEPWVNAGPSLVWVSEWLKQIVALLQRFVARLELPPVPKAKKVSAAVQGQTEAPKKKLSAKERQKLKIAEKAKQLEREKRQVEMELKEKEAMLKEEIRERQKEEAERRKARQLEKREEKERLSLLESEADEPGDKAKLERKAMKAAQMEQQDWSEFYGKLARNDLVQFSIAVFMVFAFYNGVVMNIKKRKKDFDDRVKMKRAEDEEKRMLDALQAEMLQSGNKDMTEEELKARLEEENNPLIAASKEFMKSGAKVTAGRLAKAKGLTYLDTSERVTFDDVAGLGDIRYELEEVVEFFVNSAKYLRRGSRIPTGVLLCGPPGVGKTLLAKAVAGEAGVSFFSISASQFVEVYVGVGAARVRALYNEARLNAPAVVFIDELDAVGRQRGVTQGSGGQERDATLNQLLMCLDGFENTGQVITIAATNRSDVLDTALVRPGRFDRKINIPLPDHRGRAEVLKVHARGKPVARDVNFSQIAGATAGMSGAQLANVVNSAALLALRDNRTQVEMEDLSNAVNMENSVQAIKPRFRSEQMTRLVAFHEAAMAVVGGDLARYQTVSKMSIVPVKHQLMGWTSYKTDAGQLQILGAVTLNDFLDFITLQLASREADLMWNDKDDVSVIWIASVHAARSTARKVVLSGLTDQKYFYSMYESFQDLDKVHRVDRVARQILLDCQEKARKILARNRKVFDILYEKLLAEEEIEGEEVNRILAEHGDYDRRFEISTAEVWERHRAALQEKSLTA